MITTDGVLPSQLSSLPLFQDLSPDQLEAACATLTRRDIPAGQEVMCESQFGGEVYFLVKGVVRICIFRNGQEVIFGMRGPGDVVGEIRATDGLPGLATVITQTPCSFLVASQDDFTHVLKQMGPFSSNFASFMARRIRRLTAQFEAMATLTVPGRLARQLCFMADEYGHPIHVSGGTDCIEIPFRLTQTDLSHMIGATRVQVNQILNQWRRRGLLNIQSGRITLLDDATLRSLIS